MYIKRQTISKTWQIPRKGTKYIVVPSHDKKNGLPLLVILRDVLKVAKDRREVKKILQSGKVSLNGKIIKKEKFSILPFDIIKIGEKSYELRFSDKGKFVVRETKRTERILKVVGKKILRGKKVQLNLLYGRNIISNKKVNIGDSIVLEGKKIAKVLPVEKGREVVVFAGKYKGKEGRIESVDEKEKIVTLSCENEKINVSIKSVMVIG